MKLVAEVPWWFRTVIRRLGERSTIAVVVAALIATVLLGAAVVALEEYVSGTSGPRSYLDALWWFVVTITGVGLEAVAPESQLGHASSAAVLLLARIFFGMFTAAIASALINRLLMEGRGMGDVVLRGHAVICGWNGKGVEIVKQLTRDERKQAVVILAELEMSPVQHGDVHFVRGDPTNDKDLRRASVQHADTAIILADETYPGQSDSTVDARTVMAGLSVKSANPSIYAFAEVRQPDNRDHFRHAGVDEILVANELVSSLIARASVLHGLSRVVTDLLQIGTGSDLYLLPAPRSLVGKSFDYAMNYLQTAKRAILIGLDRDGKILMNPQEPVDIRQADNLVVIARKRIELE